MTLHRQWSGVAKGAKPVRLEAGKLVDVLNTTGEEFRMIRVDDVDWARVAFWSPTPVPIDIGPPGNPFRWRKPEPPANWFLQGDDVIEVQTKGREPLVLAVRDVTWDAVMSWRLLRVKKRPAPDVSALLKACGAITLDVLAANPGLEPIAKEYARLIK